MINKHCYLLLVITFVCHIFLWTTDCLSQVNEDALKSQWILNIIPYVDWKDKNIKTYNICTVGRDNVFLYLSELVDKNSEYPKSRFVIKRISITSNLSDCNAVYIAKSETANLKSLLEKILNKQILTLSNITNFSESGGMVEFKSSGNEIKLKINEKPAKLSRLVIDSDLLNFAEHIYK